MEANRLSEETSGATLPSVNIRVLRNYTLEVIEPFLKFHCYQKGCRPSISFSEFSALESEIFDSRSETNNKSWDLIFLSIWIDSWLSLEELWAIDPVHIWNRLESCLTHLLRETQAPIIVTSLLSGFSQLRRINLGKKFSLGSERIDEINSRLLAFTKAEPRISIVDVRDLIEEVGASAALDSRFWYLYSQPFKNDFLNILSERIAGIISQSVRPAKKILVLDCDNTLWGGVVGEDGLAGIALGPHSYPGCVFYDFQKQLRELKQTGVLLALCSKNNEGDVLEVLSKHPHSLLKQSDLVAWEINWNEKAENLERLAKKLSLGLDSFVFVDDSAHECELVGTLLPDITVLQVPSPIYDFPKLLQSYDGFDRLRISSEDRARTQLYKDEFQREKERGAYETFDEFLRALKIQIAVKPVQTDDVARVSQLTLKTNQFNLTTHRYSEAQIAERLIDSRFILFVLSVRDRFGDYGQTGVVIFEQGHDVLLMDTFLMSCRVLGKSIEFVFLKSAIMHAHSSLSGIRLVNATYIPTKKNGVASNFLKSFGFVEKQPMETSMQSEWYFEIGSPLPVVGSHISIISSEGQNG